MSFAGRPRTGQLVKSGIAESVSANQLPVREASSLSLVKFSNGR